METDHLNLWQRMIHAAADGLCWYGNSTDFGLAWVEVEVEDAWFWIHERLKDLVSIEPGEPEPYAIVTENNMGQVEVLTFSDPEDFSRAIRRLQWMYDQWLDSRE